MEQATIELTPEQILAEEFDTIINYRREAIANHEKVIALMVLHKNAILAVGKLPTPYCDGLDFDNPNRSQALALMKVFGGNWTKEVVNNDSGTISYYQMIDGIRVRLWSAPPPPSCRVIEKQVLIPAQPEQWVAKRVLQCEEGTDNE